MITRRFFGLGVAALIAAPAIVRFDAIMPVRSYATGGFTLAEIEVMAEQAIQYYVTTIRTKSTHPWPYTEIRTVFHKADYSDLDEPYLSAVKAKRAEVDSWRSSAKCV